MDMEGVVGAEDIVNDLYDEDDSDQEDVVDDLNYDLFNLVARNYHSIPVSSGDDLESVLREHVTRATQLLVKKVFECPIEKSEVGPVAKLPAESSKLPREKSVPEPKPETKWEKFAKEKGITKKKRERMVYDDEKEQFAPRYGYKRANAGEAEEAYVMEVKKGQDPYADPWELARDEKKKRIEKNKIARDKNLQRAERPERVKNGKKERKNAALNGSAESTPGIPVDMFKNDAPGKKTKTLQRGKDGLKSALQLAQVSTQSLGRFDEMRPGEPVRKMAGKKRSFRDSMTSTSGENAIMKSQLKIVNDKIHKKQKHVKNSVAEYEGILPDAPSNSFKQKKGKMTGGSKRK
jgi:regulator of ribosome biosynthesis